MQDEPELAREIASQYPDWVDYHGHGGMTALETASTFNRQSSARTLIGLGASVHVGSGGETPLHSAARRGHAQMCQLLLDSKASVNRFASDGYLPIHLAMKYGRVDCASVLLRAGAAPFAEDNSGRQAIHYALQNSSAVFGQLLDACNALVNAKTKIGKSLIHVAAKTGSVDAIRTLVARGADVDEVWMGKERTPAKGTRRLSETPLLAAVHGDQPAAVAVLLELGADLEFRNAQGLDALQLAQDLDADASLRVLRTFQARKSLESQRGARGRKLVGGNKAGSVRL
jgi:ankyrin